MKKISFLFLALICAMSLMAVNVKIDGLYYSLGSTTAQLISDQSSDKSTYKPYTTVTVPASVYYDNYTYPVTSIGTSAFEGCTNLQSVTLPSSITVIYTDAFYGCTKLGDVNLPEGLTTIYLRAFYNCNLDTIIIPSTVTSIGNKAFQSNPIKSVTWLPANCSIGTDDSAPFYSTNSKITSFTFGNQVQTIPAYLCKNMSLLDTIVLPPSVSSLGQYAFMYCTSLKSINLPVTQKTLPISFLEGCTSLESIELPATLTTISQDAFYGCSKLANVNLHEGITTINQRAFFNCKLTNITIPQTVSYIGSKAFQDNPTTSVTWLPKTCDTGSDDSAPFYSTSSKITSFVFGDSVQTIPAYLCKYMSLLDTIVLPPSVSSLGQNAFMYCTSLKSINLPVTQKTLPISFLEGCTSLE
ncbi:MAG: leucine-rich repeat domain-containing protein, partial [Paludibacteraceae bacterium]|nr:leucine-rich repeat domain-containing protein [Paludibacteraceae bacterium]